MPISTERKPMTGAVIARPMPVGIRSPSRQLVVAEGEVEPDDGAEDAEDRPSAPSVFIPPATMTPTTAPMAMPGPQPRRMPKSTAPLAAWAAHRAERGEDDGRERGREADLHDLRPVVAERGEGVEEGRHQDDAAADAEQAGDHPGEGADGDEQAPPAGAARRGAASASAGPRRAAGSRP